MSAVSTQTKAATGNKTIQVGYLARVEGEGGLNIKIKGGQVADVKLNIFEPPRFFEGFMRGRSFREAPDITARICGICPVAYQMSSCQAMESAYGVTVDGQLRELRKLLYCGEWIESHVLHIYMLHAPDFLGYQDAISLAKDHPELVERALKLKKIGNDIMNLVGGREIHPINVRVGGFYKAPTKAQLQELVEPLRWALEVSQETVKITAGLEFPDFERDYIFVSLRHETEYPILSGRLVSNQGLDIPVAEYENHFEELHVAHSNALHSNMKGVGPYFVGPMARFNLNFDRLHPLAQQAAKDVNLLPDVRNPFKSIVVRAVETVHAVEEALRIIEQYEQPAKASVPVGPQVLQTPARVRGFGCSEAPRGILYHRYTLDEAGNILDAKITPPTSQNQKTIEDDLRDFVITRLNLPDDKLKWQCEQAVRNYDPCISCATHFLRLTVERE